MTLEGRKEAQEEREGRLALRDSWKLRGGGPVVVVVMLVMAMVGATVMVVMGVDTIDDSDGGSRPDLHIGDVVVVVGGTVGVVMDRDIVVDGGSADFGTGRCGRQTSRGRAGS